MTLERQQAQALLDLLPDHKLNAVRSLLEVMVEPVAVSLATAPVEGDEITPETAAALDCANALLARGEGIAHEDILRRVRHETVSEPPRARSSGRRNHAPVRDFRTRLNANRTVSLIGCISL